MDIVIATYCKMDKDNKISGRTKDFDVKEYGSLYEMDKTTKYLSMDNVKIKLMKHRR